MRTAGFENDFLCITRYPAPIADGVNLVGVSECDYTIAIRLFQNDIYVVLHACRMGAWRNGERIALPPAVRGRLIESGIVVEPT